MGPQLRLGRQRTVGLREFWTTVAVVQVRLRGAYAISHCAIQRLLVHTGPVSGGYVSASPKILRSAQETLALVARQRDR